MIEVYIQILMSEYIITLQKPRFSYIVKKKKKNCSFLFLPIAFRLIASPSSHIISFLLLWTPSTSFGTWRETGAKQMAVEWQKWKKEMKSTVHSMQDFFFLASVWNHGTCFIDGRLSLLPLEHGSALLPDQSIACQHGWWMWSGGYLILHLSFLLLLPIGTHQPQASFMVLGLFCRCSCRADAPGVAFAFSYCNIFYPNSQVCCWCPLALKLRKGKGRVHVMREAASWRHSSPHPLSQTAPPCCRQWRLSAGGQTLEQTLPIREVTLWLRKNMCLGPQQGAIWLRGERVSRKEQGSGPQGLTLSQERALRMLLSGKDAGWAVDFRGCNLEVLLLHS